MAVLVAEGLSNSERSAAKIGLEWRTPNTRDGLQAGYKDMRKLADRWANGHQTQLCDQVQMWPTPTVHGVHNRAGLSPNSGDGLSTAVKSAMWPTPRQEDGESTGMSAARLATRDPDNLPTAVKLWPTPNVVDAKGGTRNGKGQTQLCHIVQTDARLWPTPASRDFRAPNNPDGASRLSRPPTSGEQLPNAVGGVLSPDWVELMMGFPPGWTAIDDPSFGRRRRADSPAKTS